MTKKGNRSLCVCLYVDQIGVFKFVYSVDKIIYNLCTYTCTHLLYYRILMLFGFFIQYLDSIKQFIHENLRHVAHAPSVEMQDIPPDLINLETIDHPETDPDVRNNGDEERRFVLKVIFLRQVNYFGPE